MEVTPNAARAWTFTRRQWLGVCVCASDGRRGRVLKMRSVKTRGCRISKISR
jgi:hypothetical protein